MKTIDWQVLAIIALLVTLLAASSSQGSACKIGYRWDWHSSTGCVKVEVLLR